MPQGAFKQSEPAGAGTAAGRLVTVKHAATDRTRGRGRPRPILELTLYELGASEGRIGGELYVAKPLNVKGVIGVIERSLAN